MKHLIYIAGCMFLISCYNGKIEITPEYIINENWNEKAKSIRINKMRLKKDSILDLADLNQVKVTERLEEDPLFNYVANARIGSGEKYAEKKIYFNKDNGFYWWTNEGNTKTKILGNLQKECWYKFSDLLTYPYYVYLYIDSANNLHRQDVEVSNF